MKSIQAAILLTSVGFVSLNSAAQPLTESEVKILKQNVITYMSAWNVQSESERVSMLEQATNPGFVYQDPSSAGYAINNAQLVSNWIGGFQGQMRDYGLWPYDAALVSNIEVHGSVDSANIRFNWHITALGGAVSVAEGVDYGTASNLKLNSITGFFGALTPKCQSPQWQGGETYVGDSLVTFKDAIYQAKWWTQASPEEDTEVWVKLRDCTISI
ncbi:hypothetical protein N474_23385 [Pseudoalteromonas luteoviolacea CPMOR-2]|uniref:Chitin-binding type-3 domain-containing protein n=1 Tax=Pseudoalteromonas luteoviolacea DSM 6061 TaxID=1365250 RepID=A0A166Z934_9GAMM|nr:hypothetical protein [Pseudoalteromonas luteoviolacea]KZN44071.1 hypothetical protein N475_08155 [Pseudoalteromonas luteoviolacea DSM 6061]KZN52161.1 hypothetical protein N474_23385 [Pseudoalteromonas luteoviolacea CPMOR-2]MBE0386184.1 hypothetical protein [Pseudoalteromonas luteoviolacea DSM 6061]